MAGLSAREELRPGGTPISEPPSSSAGDERMGSKCTEKSMGAGGGAGGRDWVNGLGGNSWKQNDALIRHLTAQGREN